MNHHFDAVVAGAGLSGLIAANHLLDKGLRVLVLEKSMQPGGRGRTKKSEALLNQGAHAVYRKGALAVSMQNLGLPVQGGVVQGSGAWFMREGTLEALPDSAGKLLFSGALPGRSIPNMLRIYASMLSRTPRQNELFGEWLERLGADDAVRDFFLMLTRLSTYCASPELMNAAAIGRQFKKSLGGVLYPHGGWQTLIDGLVKRFLEKGGVMRLGEGISTFTEKDGVCIASEKAEYTSDALILAIEPARIRAMRPDLLSHFTEVPVRAACLDLVLDRLPNPERTFALDLHRPWYLSVHSQYADLQGIVVHNLRYLKPGEQTTRAEMEAWAESVQPGTSDVTRFAQFLPSMKAAESDANHRLASPRLAEGIYACGDWAGGDMLADAAAASAVEAAALAALLCRRAAA